MPTLAVVIIMKASTEYMRYSRNRLRGYAEPLDDVKLLLASQLPASHSATSVREALYIELHNMTQS